MPQHSNIALPLPGAYTTFTLIFVNLLAAFASRLRWNWRGVGMIICHLGILLLLLGCFVTHHYSREGHLTLLTGQSSDQFSAYRHYELAVIDRSHSHEGRIIVFPEKFWASAGILRHRTLPFQLRWQQYWPACRAFRSRGNTGVGILAGADIQIDPNSSRKETVPGGKIEISVGGRSLGQAQLVAFHPLDFEYAGKQYRLQLRQRRYSLPFTLKLLNFRKETHPGTDKPKLFESQVGILTQGDQRQTRISMNRPLYYRGYTFYQSSYAVTTTGQYQSTLAVVKNPARAMPYLSCILIFAGMMLHFLIKVFGFIQHKDDQA